MLEKAHIVYFSGTGGTSLAAQKLAEALEKEKITTKTDEIFKNNPIEISLDEILIVMYPVYAADAPRSVKKWIKSMDSADKCRAYVISVSGGGEISPNTACRKRTVRRLEKKGYEVFGEYMLCMPSNFIEPTDEDAAVRLINILPQKCGKIADDISNGIIARKKVKSADNLLLVLFAMEKLGSKVFGKTLRADDACNACGLCEKKCPMANIRMENGKPKFGWNCVICMRCVYSCPQRSVKTSMPILKNMVLKDGYDLKSIQKKAECGQLSDTEDKLEGYIWKGVKNYLENADIV